METKLVKRIFATAGSLDRKTRRRLAPDEQRYGRQFDRSFAKLEAAVQNNEDLTRDLLLLEEATSGLAVSEAEVAIQLTLAEASRRDRFICGGRLIHLVPLAEVPPRSRRIRS